MLCLISLTPGFERAACSAGRNRERQLPARQWATPARQSRPADVVLVLVGHAAGCLRPCFIPEGDTVRTSSPSGSVRPLLLKSSVKNKAKTGIKKKQTRAHELYSRAGEFVSNPSSQPAGGEAAGAVVASPPAAA